MFGTWLESAVDSRKDVVSFGSNEWELLEEAGKMVKEDHAVTVCFYASREDRGTEPATVSYVGELVGTSRGDGVGYGADKYRPPIAIEQNDSNNAVYYAIRGLRRLDEPRPIAEVLRLQRTRYSPTSFAENFVPRRPLWI